MYCPSVIILYIYLSCQRNVVKHTITPSIWVRIVAIGYSYTPESSTWDLNISDFTFTWHQGLPTRRSRVSLRKLFGFMFCLHWRICSIPIEGFVADISLIAALNGYATEVLAWDYRLLMKFLWNWIIYNIETSCWICRSHFYWSCMWTCITLYHHIHWSTHLHHPSSIIHHPSSPSSVKCFLRRTN